MSVVILLLQIDIFHVLVIQAKQAGTEAEVNRRCFQLNVSFLQMDMTQRHGVDTAVGECVLPVASQLGGSGTRNTSHVSHVT